jgi:hypothetical protein
MHTVSETSSAAHSGLYVVLGQRTACSYCRHQAASFAVAGQHCCSGGSSCTCSNVDSRCCCCRYESPATKEGGQVWVRYSTGHEAPLEGGSNAAALG